MAIITLLRKNLTRAAEVEVRSQEYRTLLSLIQEYEVADECLCQENNCGKCAIRVVPAQSQLEPRQVRLDSLEKDLLYKAGKLTKAEYEADTIPNVPSMWRLACQYVVRYEDIFVAV